MQQLLRLAFHPLRCITDPTAAWNTQCAQNVLILVGQKQPIFIAPWIDAETTLESDPLGETRSVRHRSSGDCDQEFEQRSRRRQFPQSMQACADLGFLQFAEVGLDLLQGGAPVGRLRAGLEGVGSTRPVQFNKQSLELLFQCAATGCAELTGLDVFIEQ